ncbi:hypothetical protein ACIBQ3_15340 [Streptomyces rubiginosohelvolus]|uniref:hypothetical protein n=1 Tax=Streptomyces rubiginosohelvolus TaxID=67362 RepID=UPI00378EF3B0
MRRVRGDVRCASGRQLGSGHEQGQGRGSPVDLFEVTAEDVDTAFCLSVPPPEPEAALTSVEGSLSVTVEEDRC